MKQAVMKMENKGRSGCEWMSEPMQEECLESTQDHHGGAGTCILRDIYCLRNEEEDEYPNQATNGLKSNSNNWIQIKFVKACSKAKQRDTDII